MLNTAILPSFNHVSDIISANLPDSITLRKVDKCISMPTFLGVKSAYDGGQFILSVLPFISFRMIFAS